MPDPAKILTMIRRAATLSRASSGRKGAVIHLDDSAEDVIVVGDLHGNLFGIKRILEIAQLDKHTKRHLVLQELVHGRRFYPNDGGDQSHQLVDVVAALKCQYPQRVHIILGNHELAEITGRVIGKGGVALNEVFRQGIQTAYQNRADEVYQAYLEMFKSMPLAVKTPNRVFICHTIPDRTDLDAFDINIVQTGVGLWDDSATQRGGTVYAMTWGRDTTPETADRFASMVDADLFINGHQPCPDTGFMQPNHRQVIIDGTSACPAYTLFHAHQPVTIESLIDGTKLVPMPDL